MTKGARRKYSGPVYDIEKIDKLSTEVFVEERVVEVVRAPIKYEDLSWYKQLIYDGIEKAIPYVADGVFYLACKGIHAGSEFIKRIE